jgi:hypothetical protein
VLVGSGGREHALAAALAASPLVGEVHCLPGNGGTMAEMMGGKVRNAGGIIASTMVDNAAVIEYVRGVDADMVVIGPEQPLVDGLVDELRAECPDVMAFGPTSAGARLEASKVRLHTRMSPAGRFFSFRVILLRSRFRRSVRRCAMRRREIVHRRPKDLWGRLWGGGGLVEPNEFGPNTQRTPVFSRRTRRYPPCK